MNRENPLVSICCITYNHRNHIARAIEGFLMQRTIFNFEILIHDDASTDGTAEIVKKYQEMYPDKIFAILQSENQFSKGIKPLGQILYPLAKGKYIAICEGDDYWINPFKLQSQFDILENNKNVAMCFHNAIVLNEFQNEKYINVIPGNFESKIYNAKEFFQLRFNHGIPTASNFARKEILMEMPDWRYKFTCGDFFTQMWCAVKGQVYFSSEISSVYNNQSSGLSKTIVNNYKQENRHMIEMMDYFNKLSNYKYNNLFAKAKKDSIYNYEKHTFYKKYGVLLTLIFFPASFIKKIQNWKSRLIFTKY